MSIIKQVTIPFKINHLEKNRNVLNLNNLLHYILSILTISKYWWTVLNHKHVYNLRPVIVFITSS